MSALFPKWPSFVDDDLHNEYFKRFLGVYEVEGQERQIWSARCATGGVHEPARWMWVMFEFDMDGKETGRTEAAGYPWSRLPDYDRGLQPWVTPFRLAYRKAVDSQFAGFRDVYLVGNEVDEAPVSDGVGVLQVAFEVDSQGDTAIRE